MKLFNLLFTCVFFVSFFACKKYEEGPHLSFRTARHRLVNNWEVSQLLVNNNDSTSTVPAGYVEAYTKEHIVDYYMDNGGGGSSTWKFKKEYTQIERGGIAGIPTVTLTILKLQENHFWYTYTDDQGNKYEYRMKTH
jgi:hypothetical protein